MDVYQGQAGDQKDSPEPGLILGAEAGGKSPLGRKLSNPCFSRSGPCRENSYRDV